MEILCKVCGEKAATIVCLDCKQNETMCKDCFEFLHKADAKKAHKNNTLLITEMINEKALIQTPQSVLDCKCKEHEIPKKYFCKKCEITVCAECLLSEAHKNHESLKYNEVKVYLKNELQNMMKEYEATLDNLGALKNGKGDKYEILAKGHENARANVNLEFSIIEELMKKCKMTLIAKIDDVFSQVAPKKINIDHAITECLARIGSIKAMSKEMEKDISPDRIDMLMKEKVLFPSDIIEKAVQFKKQQKALVGEISNQLFVTSRMNERINFSVDFENIFDNIARIAKEKSAGYSNYADTAAFYWNINIAYDPIMKNLYIIKTYATSTKIMVYSNIENFLVNNIDQMIKFDFSINMHFLAAHSGFLYYTRNGYSIIQYDLKAAKITREIFLHDTATHPKEVCEKCKENNTFLYKLLADPVTNKLFLLKQNSYYDSSTYNFKYSVIEIISNADGIKIKDPISINSITFLKTFFLINGLLYFCESGSSGTNFKTNYFDLNSHKQVRGIKFEIPIDASNLCIVPIAKNLLIECNQNKGATIYELNN